MFTGLVEETGTVRSVHRRGRYQLIEIAAVTILEGTRVGDSIAVDGACQTVSKIDSDRFFVEALDATLTKTTLGEYRTGRRVHLERALAVGDRLGGHLVQGHVDGTGRVSSVRQDGENVYLRIGLPDHLLKYCVAEGSIAVDGVSLTIAGLADPEIEINVIPTTWRETVFPERRVGDAVNLEVDLLARYVERLLSGGDPRTGTRDVPVPTASPAPNFSGPGETRSAGTNRPGLTEERLIALGYGR
ncbi:MAG: riboflavin synthase [Alkalispirochaeta sp.]